MFRVVVVLALITSIFAIVENQEEELQKSQQLLAEDSIVVQVDSEGHTVVGELAENHDAEISEVSIQTSVGAAEGEDSTLLNHTGHPLDPDDAELDPKLKKLSKYLLAHSTKKLGYVMEKQNETGHWKLTVKGGKAGTGQVFGNGEVGSSLGCWGSADMIYKALTGLPVVLDDPLPHGKHFGAGTFNSAAFINTPGVFRIRYDSDIEDPFCGQVHHFVLINMPAGATGKMYTLCAQSYGSGKREIKLQYGKLLGTELTLDTWLEGRNYGGSLDQITTDARATWSNVWRQNYARDAKREDVEFAFGQFRKGFMDAKKTYGGGKWFEADDKTGFWKQLDKAFDDTPAFIGCNSLHKASQLTVLHAPFKAPH